jgi:hypothetical protein
LAIGTRARSLARRILASPRWSLWQVAFVVALGLPSLNWGFRGDDIMQRVWLLGSARFPQLDPALFETQSALGLHTSFDPRTNVRLIDLGVLPWWTATDLRVACLRPLAGLTQRLDYRLWPQSALLMHVHNLAWAALCVVAAARLYRRTLASSSPAVAGLAGLLFAVDSAHGLSSYLMAYRNGLLALFFCILTVHVHMRRREDAWRPGAILAPVFLAASVLSAEVGVATLAYLVAHALCLDRGSPGERARALLPCLAVALVWQVFYVGMGYGVQASGPYLSPMAEPVRLVGALIERAPAYLFGQLIDLDLMLVLLGAGRRLWLLGVVGAVVVGAALLPLLRRDATARFWAVGMLLCLVPIGALLPEGRRLLFTSLGAAGLFAQLLPTVIRSRGALPRGPWATAAVVGVLLASSRLLLSPLVLLAKAGAGNESRVIQLALDEAVEKQTLVVLNPPSALWMMGLPYLRALEGQPIPFRARVLAASASEGRATRIDDHTLAVRVKGGYLDTLHDTLFRDPRRAMQPGDRIVVAGLAVEVVSVKEDGRPWEVQFRFDVPLEDASLRWVQWQGGEYAPLVPPGLGEVVEFSVTGVQPATHSVP